MNPALLLSLWRERWAKAHAHAQQRPYAHGKFGEWIHRFARLSVWSLPGLSSVVGLLFVLLLVPLLLVRFDENGQIAFSAFLMLAALLLRRYGGTLTTLTLMALALLVSCRYLYWRFSATLEPELNLAFILGFGLCVAELHLFILTALGFIQAVWPLRRAQTPLPDDSTEWPTVDVFIPCVGQEIDAITSTTMAAMVMDWPDTKIKIFLIDSEHRNPVQVIAGFLGVTYLALPVASPETQAVPGVSNAVLTHTSGELIAILECGKPPSNAILGKTVGWFVSDKSLGLLTTPYHFVFPSPSKRALEVCGLVNRDSSFALIRRSMLKEAVGAQIQQSSAQTHLALAFQSLGHGSAYLELATQAPPAAKPAADGLAIEAQSDFDGYRVDSPFRARLLGLRLLLSSLGDRLQFYESIPRLAFLLAPLPFLVAGVPIIQASPELLLAFALPHLFHNHAAKARLNGKLRFTVWRGIHEAALACYLLLPTAKTLVKTEIAQLRSLFRRGGAEKKPHFDWLKSTPFIIVLTLNVLGFGVGLVRFTGLVGADRKMAVLYLLWCAYNLLLLAAIAAVAEEARQIRHHRRLQMHLPAMIRLPSGWTLRGVTDNFPEPLLNLSVPTSLAVPLAAEVRISIFCGEHEFAFPARVESISSSGMAVRIAQEAQADYLALGQAARSRGYNWPKWLPDRDADRPFHPWLTKALTAKSTTVFDLAKKLTKYLRLNNLTHLWKKKK